MFELKGKYTGYDPVSNDEEALFPAPPRKERTNLNACGVISVTLAVMGTVFVIASGPFPNINVKKPSFNADSNPAGSINFGFKRVNYKALSYFDLNNKDLTKYAFLRKYVALVEPHVDMEFIMYDRSEYNADYTVCSQGTCISGSWLASNQKAKETIKMSCSPHDTLSVEVKQYDEKKNLVNTVVGNAVCMYVRREIRSLTEEDLDKFIEVSARLSAVNDQEGQSLYGEKYLSSSSLVKYHHFNAVQQNQDHIHEGNGFLIQHVKMTNMFEISLQAVDPTQSLPYWDFTIDSAEGLTTNVASIFTDKIYGTNYQPKNVTKGWTYSDDLILNGRIADGHWKDMKVEMNPYPGDPYEFGYGYMRAPWNMNPSPYLSRYTFIETTAKSGYSEMPTCSDHYDILQFDDQMDFYYDISYAPHGTLHILEGGFYGCDLLQPLVDAGYVTDYNSVCYFWVFTLKELYRAGAITPNKNCVVAENIQDSYCGYTLTDYKTFVATISTMLKAGIDSSKEGFNEAMVNFVCGGDGARIFPGDHLESASPADPSFWVIHPTLERLLQAKQLAGGFEGDGAWPTDVKEDYVCTKSMCTENGVKTYYEDCCYGHFQDDRMYDGVAGSLEKYFGPTNRETEEALNAVSMDYSMNYIYDSFDWSHCEEDFDQLFIDLQDDMTALQSGDKTAVRKVPRPESQTKAIARKQAIVKNTNLIFETSL